MLSAEQMCSLPEFFRQIPDPRRGQGRRHPLHMVPAIAAAATLCGAHGLLEINRCHYVIDSNFDEDRIRIRTGHGPQNVSRLRRFAVALIQPKPGRRVAETLRRLNRKVRTVFDYLLMSENARRTPCPRPAAHLAPPAPV